MCLIIASANSEHWSLVEPSFTRPSYQDLTRTRKPAWRIHQAQTAHWQASRKGCGVVVGHRSGKLVPVPSFSRLRSPESASPKPSQRDGSHQLNGARVRCYELALAAGINNASGRRGLAALSRGHIIRMSPSVKSLQANQQRQPCCRRWSARRLQDIARMRPTLL